MTSDEMIVEARSIVARLIVACEMDDLEGVVAGVRVLGALFGEPDPDKAEEDNQARAEDSQYPHTPLATAAGNEQGPTK